MIPSVPLRDEAKTRESVFQRLNRILESRVDASIDPGWLWKARLAACVSAIAATAAGPLYFLVDAVVSLRLYTTPLNEMSLGLLCIFFVFQAPYVLVFVQLRKNPLAAGNVGLAMGTAAGGLLFTRWMFTRWTEMVPDSAVGPRWLWQAGAILSGVVQLLVTLIYFKIYSLLGKQKYKALALILGSIIGLSIVVVTFFITTAGMSIMP